MKLNNLALVMSGVIALYGCGGSSDRKEAPAQLVPDTETAADPTVDASAIAYNDIPVHDPSVIRTNDGTFYVVGSHLAAAKSTDLVTWEQVAPGINLETPDFAANPLFSNYDIEVAEGIEWTGGYAGSWASDVIQLSDDRYYFYYNHCTNPDTGECDAPRSYLGVAVADDILGPYSDLGIFLRSGQSDAEIDAGFGVGDMESYNGFVNPNTIDPDTFYDKNGQLWMTYGSYAGGIFILEMDETTAMPKPNQGYGKHLTGGDHSSIEGSYVLYSPESDYYYLFASFGGFVSTDGYNIRIARSRTPDGPYLDAAGNDIAAARGGWDSIEPYGVKLMGGFNFNAYTGDASASRGYLAPGHNSAYYDEATGQHFLITHTRFPNRGEGHAIRVHEMFVNADGWLIASPERYAPIEGDNIVDAGDIVGDYKFINLGKDINREAKQSVAITLTDNREITGDITGYYRLYDNEPNRITVFIDGDTSYEGVMRWQWDAPSETLTPVFSALNGDGATIWGVQQPEQDNAQVIQAVLDDLSLPENFKGEAIDLPTVGTRGSTISWSSDNGRVIKTDGTVIRPNAGDGDQSVRLTATVSRQGASSSQAFDIVVPERQTFNRVAAFDFEGDLSETLGNFAAGSATGDRVFNTGMVDFSSGHDGQALSLDGSNGVLLPQGLINNYEYTVSFWVNPNVITGFTPAFFGAVNIQQDDAGNPFSNNWINLLPQGWDGNTMFWSGSEAWLDGTTGERIPEMAWSHVAFSVKRGLVKVFINGEEKFSAGNLSDFFSDNEGTFALGVNYWDIPFNGLIDELNIYEAALAGGEIKALDIDKLPSSELLASAEQILDLGDISAVQDDLYLPVTGPYASAINWSSSDPSVIAIDADTGVVTRPGRESSNVDVTLTAAINLDGQATSKTFVATVSSLAPPEPVATFSFEEDLADSTGNFGMGTATADRLGNTGGVVNFLDGVVGKALMLDGTAGVKLPNNLITDSTYSISMWLNPNVLAQFTPAFFGAATDASWISVVPFGPGDGNTMLWSGTAWYDGDTGSQIPAKSWTHFVAVNNAGNLKLYLNGVETFAGANFPDVFTPAATTQFGIGVNFWDTPYTGMMDELKIFDEPISAEDVTTLYQEGNM